MKFLSILIFASAVWNTSVFAQAADVVASVQDEVQPPGLPSIGKWMIDENGNVSHWLGYKLGNQVIDEPINIILRVTADSIEDAQKKLINAASSAGYEVRSGHSTGYSALINHEKIAEYPATPDSAFSDAYYLLDNNHGRVFGPILFEGKYFFTAALSREDVALAKKLVSYVERDYSLLHPYASFMEARQDFADQLCKSGAAKNSGLIDLGNSIPPSGQASSTETTGDYDGLAILLDL